MSPRPPPPTLRSLTKRSTEANFEFEQFHKILDGSVVIVVESDALKLVGKSLFYENKLLVDAMKGFFNVLFNIKLVWFFGE